MRIAYVTETYPPELNGVAFCVERTVRHLRERGHVVELIRPRQRGEGPRDDAGERRTAGCPIPMYPSLRLGFATPASLARRFAATRPALVHVATQGPLGFAAARAARRLGLPWTADFRTNFHQYSAYYGFGWCESLVMGYLRRFHNRAARTFVPTRALREQLGAAGFERLEVVGRGVDTARFSPAHRDPALRASWGVQRNPVMLYVGRLAAEKNVELALVAARAVRMRLPEARMVVVGDGPLRARLEAEYPEALFVGEQRGEALAAHYASADLFVFPSLSETFGNVTLEALASGLPVVAYDHAAAAEHVGDCDSGLLAPPGDERAFVAAACNLAWQHRHLRSWSERARAAALRAQWDGVLGQFEAHLMQTAHAQEATPDAAAAVA